MGIENPVHLLFIAAVALVVLGPKRLPELARSLGRGIREFRGAMSGESDGGVVDTPEHEAGAVQQAAPVEQVAPSQPQTVAPAQPVDPPEPVRSGDHAPDRRSL
jgi:sec-independent protein translocase protein TatA